LTGCIWLWMMTSWHTPMCTRLPVSVKLDETRFFVGLLSRIQSSGSLTGADIASEATYFLSAAIGACYSVLEQLKRQVIPSLRKLETRERSTLLKEFRNATRQVQDANADLYGEGGLRHVSVHHKPIPATPRKRLLGGFGSAKFGELAFGEAREVLTLYVVDGGARQVPIVPRLERHIKDLGELVIRWATKLAELDPGG